MISFSLQSGSNGNSNYVETADARLLFDAGISGRQAALSQCVAYSRSSMRTEDAETQQTALRFRSRRLGSCVRAISLAQGRLQDLSFAAQSAIRSRALLMFSMAFA